MPKVSRYAELWETIKKDGVSKTPKGVVIAALPQYHPRFIKAIRKRKLIDLGFKFQCDEDGKGWCELDAVSEGNQVKFKLKFGIGIGDL